MKNFCLIFVVALATLHSASALKCYVCGIESDSKCEEVKEPSECLIPESPEPTVTAVNCFAAEFSKF